MNQDNPQTIISGGLPFQSVWLRCQVLVSKKSDEFIVTVHDVPNTLTDPAFYVDPELVKLSSHPEIGQSAAGRVQVILLEKRPDENSLVVEVPGEPVSYGPKLLVPQSLVVN